MENAQLPTATPSTSSKRRLLPQNTAYQRAPESSRRRRVITGSNNNTIDIEQHLFLRDPKQLTLMKDMLISFQVPRKYYKLDTINFNKELHLGNIKEKEIANPFKDKKYYILTFNNKVHSSLIIKGIITKIHRETDVYKSHIDVCLVNSLHDNIQNKKSVPLPNDLDLYKTIEIIPTKENEVPKAPSRWGGSKKVKSRKTRKMRK